MWIIPSPTSSLLWCPNVDTNQTDGKLWRGSVNHRTVVVTIFVVIETRCTCSVFFLQFATLMLVLLSTQPALLRMKNVMWCHKPAFYQWPTGGDSTGFKRKWQMDLNLLKAFYSTFTVTVFKLLCLSDEVGNVCGDFIRHSSVTSSQTLCWSS